MKQRELARVAQDEYGWCTIWIGKKQLGLMGGTNRDYLDDQCKKLNREISAHVKKAMLNRRVNKERKSGHVKGKRKQVKR